MPEQSVALTILWIWLAIVAAVVIGWWVYKKCRAPAPPTQLPYAKGLKHRLNKNVGRPPSTGKRQGK